MKKKLAIAKSGGNIFADLDLPNSEEHILKAHLVMLVGLFIERNHLTQAQAASRINVKQPDVSKLLRGRFEGFSLERLLSFVRAFDFDIEIKIKPRRPAKEGRIRIAA